jgi:S-adenosylmethionine synthetase
MKLIVKSKELVSKDVEVTERKGRGHPDTLTDNLAEQLSMLYCRYTLENYGEVLHHNFDKVGLLGGKSEVQFGGGVLTSPIRVLLNGRAADNHFGSKIPRDEMLEDWTKQFLSKELPLLNIPNDLEFHKNVSTSNTAGYPIDDFCSSSLESAKQREKILSSDTAAICVHYPLSPLEEAVLSSEQILSNDSIRKKYPWLGYDIKILAVRNDNNIIVTSCIPQISRFVQDKDEYQYNLKLVKDILRDHLSLKLKEYDVNLEVNTKDDISSGSYYLTAIGSCIESGDEGMVGRGNRPCGLIPVTRSFSGEAACGKNPLFFPGKVYNSVGKSVAKRIYNKFGIPLEVWLLAQEGKSLFSPWFAMILFEGKTDCSEREINEIVSEELQRIPEHTDALIKGLVNLT